MRYAAGIIVEASLKIKIAAVAMPAPNACASCVNFNLAINFLMLS